MTVLAAILLVPAAIGLIRFADVIIVTLFSEKYRAAAAVFQVYLLVLFREVFDFAVPLRAINRTTPMMESNLLSTVLNGLLLIVFLPSIGLVGAAIAYIISRAVEGIYLGWRAMRIWDFSLREMARWGDLGKVALSALLASSVLATDFWTQTLGFVGAMLGGLTFLAVYALLLVGLRLPEAVEIASRLRRLQHRVLVRTR
jgi:O-antigen/teichoic acid export membrane protein